MDEGTNEERLPNVDVRSNAGIDRSPLDEIKAIQTLLADVYKDAGDGRTLFRELVQNTDDAGAQRLGLVVLERGWPDARNSLLRGPALLVANNGAFPDKDREALHKAIGGSKEDEVGKIGTFGIGLKSVFHICEAFLYLGAEKSVWRAGVLNPWAGTGESGDADPLHPDWDEIDEADVERLRSATTELLGKTSNGLLLWIPLRCPEHLDRSAEGRQYGLGERCPGPDDLCAWFGCSTPGALLLAQCGHLQTIDAERAAGPESLRDRVRLVRVTRQTLGWVGRYEDDGGCSRDRTFEGDIVADARSWSVVGTEARGSESLRRLRSQSDWPQSPRWQNGRYSSEPRKALAHAAVTVLRPSDLDADLSGTRLRWAVFLPLDDDPEPGPSAIVESNGPAPAWEIILHGYFWPSQDRRSIPGVTEDIGNAAGDRGMRIRWNRALCEELLLPLLPSTLANAVAGVDEHAVRRLLDAVVRTDMVKNRVVSVIRRHWLLPIVAARGVRWKALDANSCPVLSIPKWSQAPEFVRSRFVASCDACTEDVEFIDDDAPRLTGELDDWTDDRLERLLNCIPVDALGSPQSLLWIEGLVRHVLGREACGGDIRAATVARWLVGQIGDGGLAHTRRRSASRESRDKLREAWGGLCEALPIEWLIETPVDSQQAVVELAAGDVLGDPEPQVAHLYDSVPHMDRDGLLQLMLDDSRPWRFAEQIARSVRSSEGPVLLPQDGALRDLLRRGRWLPRRDGGALAPDAVLIAPKELLHAVAGLAAAGAFGDKRLPEAVDSGIWGTAEPVVRELLGRLSRERQVQRMVDALDSNRVEQVDRGAWLVMPNPDLVNASLIEDALQTTLAGSHPGWKMVHAAARIVGYSGDRSPDSSESLVKLAKALCAQIPSDRQIEILRSLGESRPAKGSPGGRLFGTSLKCFAETDDFFLHVLPQIDLPTQDGKWRASRDVAITETGVAPRHRLLRELRPILRLSSDDPVLHARSVGNSPAGTGLDALEKYFEPWRGRVQHGAVGAFLSLLGNGLNNRIGNLAQQWLGEDVAIEPIEGLDRHAVSVWVSPRVARGDRISAVNVLGSRVEMEAEADSDTLFAVDPVRHPPSQYSALAPLGAFWEIALRDVEPQSRSRSELTELLRGTVQRWATRYLKLDRERVDAWWSGWGEGSQADFDPVLASIKAHLPLTLQQLDVKESEPLRDALREAERAQRKREQASSEETLKFEREALNRLAALIKEPQHQSFLWKRVNELMRRYGYGHDSVLLELAQNADDALAEATEIEGGPLLPATRRLLIRVYEHDGTPTVDVMHWGRPINDTGGAAFPAGRERQWDQDLYFMMLMNLSGKPGEAPGESSLSSTTGRFGLGFKSVHLVSSSPSVVSGFIAFSIAGGLLPQERAVPDETDSWMVEGRRSTRVRMPLRPDIEARTLTERLFRRFAYARVLLPVFARQVREVVVEGGPFPGVHVFDGKPIDGAPGWSVGAQTELPDHDGRWRILRFLPADAGREDMGTVALAVGLREGVPTAFDPEAEVPFLWNVTPTSENWDCGYVVNGPFKLDPGRTHVALEDDSTLQTVGGLGEALGRGLIELHNVLADPADASHGPLVIRDVRGFLSSLWRVLACGLNNPDAPRRRLLRELHGKGRGLSAWMGACSAAPSGLPAPFQPMLPPLTSDVRIEVASGDLDNQVCAILAEIEDEDLAALVDGRCIVSAEVEQLLRPLCGLAGTEGNCIAPTPLRPSDLFAELAERWDHFLTPERLRALRPIDGCGDSNFDAYDPQGATWRSALKARAADGSLHPLHNLVLRDTPDRIDHTDADGNDEFLRAAFAPDNRVLDPAYIERSEDWRVFRWLRVQHRVDAAMMAEWCADLPKDLHSPAIHYLLYGELGSSVLQRLVPIEGRPRWLREFDDVCRLVEDECEESWRRQSLLGALFPDRFRAPEPLADPIQPDSDTFFQQLLEWWDDDAVRGEVVTVYERAAWPDWLRRDGIAEGLRIDSVDHWLALLVLGACRSLGRTQDRQHRSFLELAHREGWWEVFKTPCDAGAWMGVLRDWQDDALAKLIYPRWMSLFPAIYQFSRYRDVYVRLLKSAGRRPESMYQVTRLLAPRVDEALTGAGTHFDAPPAPLNMGLHWVLRELVRLEVVGGEHLFPDCWVPSEQVLRLLGALGLERPDDGMSNSQKARAIFDFLASELGTETPSLHRAFDIPLRHVASNADLRHRFGLEQ